MFELLITYTNMKDKKTKKRVKDVRGDATSADLAALEAELLKIDTPKYGQPRTKSVEIQLIEIQEEVFPIYPKGEPTDAPEDKIETAEEPTEETGPKAPKTPKTRKSGLPQPRRLPSTPQLAKWRSKTIARKVVAYAREDLSDKQRVDDALRVMQEEAAFIASNLMIREEQMCREVYQDFLASVFLAEEWTPQMLSAFKPLKNLLKNNLRGQLKRTLYVRERVLRNDFLNAQRENDETETAATEEQQVSETTTAEKPMPDLATSA